MLKQIMKKYGFNFKSEVSEREAREELIEWLQLRANSCGSMQDSLDYLDDKAKLEKEM